MRLDIAGQHQGGDGRLRAVRPTRRKYNTLTIWRCKCDCGRTCYVPITWFRNGDTKSCGCLRRERAAEKGRRQQPRANLSELIRYRHIGFTYAALGRMFGISKTRARLLIKRYDPRRGNLKTEVV